MLLVISKATLNEAGFNIGRKVCKGQDEWTITDITDMVSLTPVPKPTEKPVASGKKKVKKGEGDEKPDIVTVKYARLMDEYTIVAAVEQVTRSVVEDASLFTRHIGLDVGH